MRPAGIAGRVLRAVERPAVTFAVLLAIALPAALMLRAPVSNGDIAWHLALGRWMARHGAIPDADPFTWTAPGAPMVAHEWLAQWLYWQWTAVFGLDGLRSLHIGLALLTLWLGFALFRRAGAAPSLALLATGIYAILVQPRFQVRPHMLNAPFAIGLCTLLFYPRPGGRRTGPALAAGITALWANLHSAASLLPVLLWTWVGVDALQRRLQGRPAWPAEPLGGPTRRGLAVAIACSLAVLATPHHVRLLPYLIESGRVNAGRSTEWLSLLRFVGTEGHFGLVGAWMLVLIATAWATLHVWRERRRLAPAALALGCALAPLQSVRFTWLAFLPLAFASGELGRWLARRTPGRRDAAQAVCGIAAAALGTVALARGWPPAAAPFFAPATFPIHSVAMLAEVPLGGRVFARPEWGGFITLVLDERVPVFADGRWITIGERIVREGHVIATGRPRALHLLDEWDVDVVLVERGWLGTPRGRPARDHAWIRAFAGYNSAIWVRRGERGRANRAAFADYYAKRGIPFDPKRGFPEAAAARANPEWARAHGVGDRSIRHFLPDGRRSEAGFEVERGEALPGPGSGSLAP